ncbi:hypothetical protein LTR70_003269 [Exophiala xenobiotica]|uniref:Uncharacterized protein n=1 Tax=Lithohypha guttulata TaxID=1690604 RepID=A0ABR0KLJ5_9EURO|nr:hypothetical protein LTR24_001144 [Lithohypha guttulata]KAK5323591.1 hypothetical protein LTR70_003269 [Exophiala xenobiotica]
MQLTIKQDPAVSKYQTWIDVEFSTAFKWVNGVPSERHDSQKQKIYPRKGNRAAKAASCLKNDQEDDYAIGLDREDESSSSTLVARRPLQPKRQYTDRQSLSRRAETGVTGHRLEGKLAGVNALLDLREEDKENRDPMPVAKPQRKGQHKGQHKGRQSLSRSAKSNVTGHKLEGKLPEEVNAVLDEEGDEGDKEDCSKLAKRPRRGGRSCRACRKAQ